MQNFGEVRLHNKYRKSRDLGYYSWLINTSDVLKVLKIARAFRGVQFWELSKHHEYLLITNCTRRLCDILFIVYSTKSWSTSQNKVTVSFYLLCSYLLQKPLKLFGTMSEIFNRLQLNFGHLLNSLGRFRKSSEDFVPPSEIFESLRINFANLWETSEIFRSLWVNFVNLWETLEILGRLRTTFWNLQKSSGQLQKSSEWCLLVNFKCLLKTLRLFRKTSCLRVWRVQFGINCTALVQSESSNFVECTIKMWIWYFLHKYFFNKQQHPTTEFALLFPVNNT